MLYEVKSLWLRHKTAHYKYSLGFNIKWREIDGQVQFEELNEPAHVTKSTYHIGEQQRLRETWTSVQSQQSLAVHIHNIIWAAKSDKICFMPYANNKGTDQPVHPRSLISAFVVRCLGSIIPPVSIYEILRLASLCSWAGWFESYLVANPEDRFSLDNAHIWNLRKSCPTGQITNCTMLRFLVS